MKATTTSHWFVPLGGGEPKELCPCPGVSGNVNLVLALGASGQLLSSERFLAWVEEVHLGPRTLRYLDLQSGSVSTAATSGGGFDGQPDGSDWDLSGPLLLWRTSTTDNDSQIYS